MRKKNIQKSNQKSKKRKLLVATLALAALIVGGSTFAWFTSKDEVTNRLSATANYGVSIAEDFQPPENWIPGQTIEKNVSVTNTGNVDAFVRSWIQGEMRVVKELPTGANLIDADDAVDATDKKYIDLGFTKYNDTSERYLKTLSTVPIANPNDSANTTNNTTTSTTAYSEVMATQAGGFLAYAPNNAQYKYTTNQETVVDNYWQDATTLVSKTLAKDTVVEVVETATAGKVKAQATDASTHFKGVDIDSDTFLPKTTGLYLFRRVVDVGTDVGTNDKYEYSGYYYVAPSMGADYGNGTYYALQTGIHNNADENVSENTVPTSQIITTPDTQSGLVDYITPSCKLLTVVESKIENSDLTWAYNPGDNGKATMKAYYLGNENGIKTYNTESQNEKLDDIVVEVALVNVGSKTPGTSMNKADNDGSTETWSKFGDAALTTFYYNNDLESGDSTSRLIDSVKLADETDKGAYVAFDFDLNVFMESKQVTVDETNKEHTTPVNTWAATTVVVAGSDTPVNTGAKPAGGNDAQTYADTNEISVVGWTALP